MFDPCHETITLCGTLDATVFGSFPRHPHDVSHTENPMTWQIFRQACLLVAGLITATFVSPVTAQEKLAVPPKARQKEVKQQLRSEKKIPKRDGSNDQNVLNAFALIDLAATEADPDIRYVLLTEAISLSDTANAWSLSRHIGDKLRTDFQVSDKQYCDWYSNAIRRTKKLTQLSELVHLFANDVLSSQQLSAPDEWKKIHRQLKRLLDRCNSPTTVLSCGPRLSECKARIELFAETAPETDAFKKVLIEKDVAAGLAELSEAVTSPVVKQAKAFAQNVDDVNALMELLTALMQQPNTNAHQVADAIFQTRVEKLSNEQIVAAQRVCFPRDERLTPDLSLPYFGPGADGRLIPTSKPKNSQIDFIAQDNAWVLKGSYNLKYPEVPMVSFIHEIDFSAQNVDKMFHFVYGRHSALRLYFSHKDDTTFLFNHRNALGSRSWGKVRKTPYKINHRVRLTNYGVCGSQYSVERGSGSGKRLYNRYKGASWLRHRIFASAGSDLTVYQSTIRPWLTGDREMFVRAGGSEDELKHLDEPKISFDPAWLRERVAAAAKHDSDIREGNVFSNALGLAMQPISAGSFERGKTRVELSNPFWVSQCEITQAQYERVLKQNPSSIQGSPHFPVDNVSYRDAMRFCQRLNEIEKNERRVPDGYQYRLLTENEWEYVARAGKTEGFSVPVTDFWHSGTSANRFHVAGSSKPNPWGVFDMHGNLEELTLDEYSKQGKPAPLETDPVRVPKSESDFVVVVRGGSWSTTESRSYPSFRNERSDAACPYRGFRVALAPIVK